MNWYVITPYNQEWYPYEMPDGSILLHAKGAETDMSDSTIDELVAIFGAVTVMEK